MCERSTNQSNEIERLSGAEIERLAADLTPEEREVILHQGTERPFCGNLLDNKREGQYLCRLCGLPIFSSRDKFDSGTGWPSYKTPIRAEAIRELPDHSHGQERVEIRCARCDGHLGHVFEDGPPPTGLRYCLNSISLRFEENGPNDLD